MTRPDRRRPPRPAAAAFAVLVAAAALAASAGCGTGEEPIPVAEAEPAAPQPPPPPGGWPAGPLFEDATAAVGVDFTRFDGRVPDAEGYVLGPSGGRAGRRMYEWPGGGVAAFDYDADGRPDLYFTQGRDWSTGQYPPGPDESAAPAHRDALYRNVGGERFTDVTEPAGVPAGGFGVGLAAGDYDGDGFPDLYVCDAAGPRLLRNGGDGTFTDVTAAAGLGRPTADGRPAEWAAWAVSAAVADLNATACRTSSTRTTSGGRTPSPGSASTTTACRGRARRGGSGPPRTGCC